MKSARLFATLCVGFVMLLLSLGLIAMITAPSSAAGTIYYVNAASGDDGRTATQAQSPTTPWKSIAHAAATVPAGTVVDPNVVQVAPGTYSAAGSGEVFPIVFANPNIILLGSGAGGTVVDGTGASDAISVTVPGVAISGLAIQNVTNDAIEVSAGKFSVSDCVFSSVAVGVDVDIDMAFVGPGSYAVEDIEVIRNTFVFSDAGVSGDISIYGGQVASTIQVGDIEVLSNTFASLSPSSVGVLWSTIEVSHVIGGQITVGNVNILSNTLTAGDTGIAFYGTLDYLTDTLVTVGDVVISSNVLRDQLNTAVDLDYYDAYRWFGTTSGNMGDIVLADNDVASNQPMSQGLLVSDITNFEDFRDSATLEIGDITFQDNDLHIDNKGIQAYYNFIDELSGSAAITVGQLSVLSNTVSAPTGRGVDLDVEDAGRYSDGDSFASIGSILVAGNVLSPTKKAVDATFNDLGYWNYDDFAFSLGDVTFTNNEISGTKGIEVEFEHIGEEMHNRSTTTLGDMSIRDNVITASADDGISFEYDSVAYTIDGSAALSMGNVTIADNDVRTAGNGLFFEFEDNTYAASMAGESSAVLHGYTVTGNTFETQADGIHYYSYGNPYALAGNSNVDFGGFLIADNTFRGNDAGYGVYLYNDIESTDSTTVTVGAIKVTGNDLRDVGSTGISVAQILYANGSSLLDVASLQVVSNTLEAGGTGISTTLDIDSFAGATLNVERASFINNVVGAAGADGIRVAICNSTVPVDLVHNTVANPTPTLGNGIYLVGDTIFITNTIVSSYTNGIVSASATVSEDYNLFYVTGSDTVGTVSSGGHSLTGLDPAFVDPSTMSYQLQAASPARDHGVATDVLFDVDGNSRIGPPDIGAYEGQAERKYVYVPLMLKES